jgi:predicted nucleotidyltransferase
MTNDAGSTPDELARTAMLDRLLATVQRDERIVGVFTTGSSATGRTASFSDIDVWYVVDEPHVNDVLADVPRLLAGAGPLLSASQSHPAHFMAMYGNLQVVDLTVVSIAQYVVLRRGASRVLLDKRGNLLERGSELPMDVCGDLLSHGHAILMRATAKVEAGQFWQVPRFCVSLRDAVLLPAIELLCGVPTTYLSSETVETMPRDLRALLAETYPAPNAQGCMRSIRAAADLLARLSDIAASQGRCADYEALRRSREAVARSLGTTPGRGGDR